MFKIFRNRRHSGKKVDALLSAYVDDALTSDEQLALEARLEREPALQERLRGLRLTVDALANLPEVETPRNFVLSAAMVAAPRPVAAPRRRSIWPVLGWATTVATLLLLVVLAGDFFVVAPSLREESTDAAAEETPSQRMMLGAEAPTLADAPAEEEGAVEIVVEKEIVVESEPVEFAAAEEEPAAEVEAPAPAMLQEPAEVEETAPTVEAETEDVDAPPPPAPEPAALPTAAPPSAEVEAPAPGETPSAMLQEPSEVQEAAPTVEADAANAGALPPPTPEPTALPPSGEGEARNDETLAAAQRATPTLVSMVDISAPLTHAASDLGAKDSDKSVPLWLRGTEIGLGLLVAGLAVATLIARRRSQ